MRAQRRHTIFGQTFACLWIETNHERVGMKRRMAKSQEPKDYYFIDVDLRTMKMVAWGKTRHATHTGATDDPLVHRVF